MKKSKVINKNKNKDGKIKIIYLFGLSSAINYQMKDE